MNIEKFKVEEWLNPRDASCKYNLGASCVKALSVEELFTLIGEDIEPFIQELRTMSLHYGDFLGLPRLLKAITRQYRDVTPDMVLSVHGGTGANNMVITELLEPGDNVIAIIPNYQQHYSIPKSLGIDVRYLQLTEENGYLPDIEALKKLVDHKTRLITLSNPNNPTGAFLEEKPLTQIAELARTVGAYILCDEIYRGLSDAYMPSIVDVYERGIVTSSMSKVFSMAGTRLGWIVTKDKATHERLENRRSYDTICCGVFDELITAIALENHEKILARGRKIVNANREILDRWLSTQTKLSCTDKSFSSTAFIRYDYDIGSEALCTDILEKTGVLLCHGDCFEMPNSFRLGYGFGETEFFKEGLDLLGAYFTDLAQQV